LSKIFLIKHQCLQESSLERKDKGIESESETRELSEDLSSSFESSEILVCVFVATFNIRYVELEITIYNDAS